MNTPTDNTDRTDKMAARHGFSLIGLVAIITALALLVVVLLPVVLHAKMASEMNPVGRHGKDIFVAIVSANVTCVSPWEISNWPADGGDFDFKNSTDYFRYLYDDEHAGTDKWSPFVFGFDYSMLAGAGVPQCKGKPLTAAHNMWTIAKNVQTDWDDTLPFLITRNVDAASLAEKVTGRDWKRHVFFDAEWDTPFGDNGFVIIRKSGAIHKYRKKYSWYSHVYMRREFDTSLGEDGKPVPPPLKYLTPTREVTPGDAVYTEGLSRWTGTRRGVQRLGM